MPLISPALSAIVPVYNKEPYPAQSLNRPINQSLKDVEIIVVNDCSPNNSEAIITKYAAQDPRIRYVENSSNLGQGEVRNSGIKEARRISLFFPVFAKGCHLFKGMLHGS